VNCGRHCLTAATAGPINRRRWVIGSWGLAHRRKHDLYEHISRQLDRDCRPRSWNDPLAQWVRDREPATENLHRNAAPTTNRNQHPEATHELIEQLRQQHHWGPNRIAKHLREVQAINISCATAHRILTERGINRLAD
jgi:hypothetical protein